MLAPRLDVLRLARGPGAAGLAWALATRPGIERVELALAHVRYRSVGSGSPTLVFVADPPNVIEHYDRLIELLAPTSRVVCLDMPGFGFSFPKRGFSYALDDHFRTFAELLERLGHAPYVLAFSCGAALGGAWLAARRPDLVVGVVNIQSGSLAEQVRWARRIDWRGVLGAPFAGQLLMAAAPGWMARKWYEIALPDPASVAPFSHTAQEALRHGACFCLASGLQQLQASETGLDPVGLPSRVLWGLADRSHRRTDKSSTRAVFPGAEWHEFEKAGHFPELEEPERFVALMRDFARAL